MVAIYIYTLLIIQTCQGQDHQMLVIAIVMSGPIHRLLLYTCCVMHYNFFLHNSGHVCATPILNATRAGEHTVFPQKDAAATIYFSANAIRGLFKGGYYSKCGVYSKKYGKRGKTQPRFKGRA